MKSRILNFVFREFESLKIKGRCCWEAKAQNVCIHDKQKQSTGIYIRYIYNNIYIIYYIL